MAYAVVMAGGAGTRFWPESRRALPKQLMKLVGDQTMLQLAVARLDGLVPSEGVYVLTNEALTAEASAQLPQVPAANIIGEPVGRDTAACIGLGALVVRRQDLDGIMVVITADHLIRADDEFRRDAALAVELAQEPGMIVTFGIRPTEAATVYGYIERGELLREEPASGPQAPIRVYRVKQFREKPDRGAAQRYLDSGQFYWNSGMFVWRAQTILDSLRESTPTLHEALEGLEPALGTPGQQEAIARAYAGLDKVSIDYAVMEQARKVSVVEATFDWDDVGSWLSMERLQGQDENGNTVRGRHVGLDTTGSVVWAGPDHLVATIGVQDLVVVHTDDATLVCHRDRVDDIKRIVQDMETGGDEFREYL